MSKIIDLSFLSSGGGGDPPKKNENDPLEFLGQPAEIQTAEIPTEKRAPLPAAASAESRPRTRVEHIEFIKIRAAEKAWAWGLFDADRGRVLAEYLACIDAHGKEVADRLQPDEAYFTFEKIHAAGVAAYVEALKNFEDFKAAGGGAPAETDVEEAARRLAGYKAAGATRVKVKGKGKGKGGGGTGGGGGGQADRPPRSRVK